MLKRVFKKIIIIIYAIPLTGFLGMVFNYINTGSYMKYFTRYLKKLGIQVNGTPKYISSSVYFDGNDYSKIILGKNITISREVMFLTHDYSITTAMASIDKYIGRGQGELYFSRSIVVGDNVFLGARVSLLPGTTIGDNCIIGACSVVKGKVPSGSIVVGNPAKVIGRTTDFVKKHIEIKDFLIEQ